MRFPKAFAEQPRGWIVAEMALTLFVIAVLDFVTSYKIRLLPFYAVPIFVVGWFCGRRAGVVAALVSSLSWWCANWFSGDPDLHSWIRVWEICRHAGFFALVALTGSALRSKHEVAAARISLLEHSQRLEHEIVNISDQEQRRIGQDLHDGLCQYLAALGCSAVSLRDDLLKSDREAEAKAAGKLATLQIRARVFAAQRKRIRKRWPCTTR